MNRMNLPTVVIGAGPVGLAAAVHLRERGIDAIVLEADAAVGSGMRRWSHVRMFSPWEYNIDRHARALLERSGWQAPDPAGYPTGGEVVSRYLEPLAALPELAPSIRCNSRVIAVTRARRDRMKNTGRDESPFVVRYLQGGVEHDLHARAVIDASGTIDGPNWLGAAGIPAIGERAASDHVYYGLPDVLGRHRTRYAGKRVLVVGSGHSAFNVLTDLARLAGQVGGMAIDWAVRRPSLLRVLGGGENDQLKERGRLGLRIARLAETGTVRVQTGFHLDRIERTPDGLVAWSGATALPEVDEIVAATGFRPDIGLLDEVRLDLDPGTQSPTALAPLIDPNLHSCGSVRPHGAMELKHPDSDLYIVGMKSYGRAPTFLLLTGYEQVRSVAAAVAGDWEAARRVELVLPETGVCSTQFAEDDTVASDAAACCGGPAPAEAEACCRKDADAKAAGDAGCGCGPDAAVAVTSVKAPTRTSSCCR